MTTKQKYDKRRYELKREEIKRQVKNYYMKNADKASIKRKEWQEKNRERVLSYGKEYRKRNPEKRKALNRKYIESGRKRELRRLNVYGVTPEMFQDMLSSQSFECPICKRALLGDKDTNIDHCHTTGKVRGLLCDDCNLGLGKFHDDVTALRNAAEYLSKHRNKI